MSSSDQRLGAPLAGIKIVAIERMLAAPYATQILADLGAEVIKVEQPGHGDETRAVAPFVEGESHYFIAVNRAKKSITLDLKHRDARTVLSRLIEQSDVVIENLRAGRLDALGYGFDWMCDVNPTIILCSISGFGADGTWSQRPAFDLIVQALSGLMSVNGEPETGPTKIALPLSDLAAGLWAAIGIAAHLAGPREIPIHLDLSMYDATIALETYLTQLVLSTGHTPGLIGSHHHAVTPYGKYLAADGWIVVALQTGVFWRRFCTAIGKEDLIYEARFRTTADRLANRAELEAVVAGIVKERTVAEWEQFFLANDVPGAPINSVADALWAPAAIERELVRTVTVGGVDVPTVGNPIRVVGDIGPHPVPVPQLGADTAAVLAEAGFSNAEIRGFETSGLLGSNKQGDST